MIVLDEQLLGRGIEYDIARWYRGKIQFITDLRPNTVIKDEVVPALLRQQSQPTFVTINDRDFWQHVQGDSRYCMVCFAWPDTRTRDIPQSLRALFHHPEFRTKRRRMGKVVRITNDAISYYTSQIRLVTTIASAGCQQIVNALEPDAFNPRAEMARCLMTERDGVNPTNVFCFHV